MVISAACRTSATFQSKKDDSFASELMLSVVKQNMRLFEIMIGIFRAVTQMPDSGNRPNLIG